MNNYRVNIAKLEKAITDSDLNIVDKLPVFHHFAHGTYTRELHIPANRIVVGKIHRYSTTNIFVKGRLLLVHEDETIEDIWAPMTFVSAPNTKKTVYTLEDCIFMNVHPWDGKQTLEEIEEEVIIKEYSEDMLCHGEPLQQLVQA